jgi:hypothetical protein
VVIIAEVVLPDGSTHRLRAWVDNGDPDLHLSRRAATLLGLAVSCNDHECSSPPPTEIVIGGMTIPLGGMKEAKIPLRPVGAASVMVAGMNAEINIPGSVLQDYDVLIDYPGRKFSVGQPGTIQFRGEKAKMQANGRGLFNISIEIPSLPRSKAERKQSNLVMRLDQGGGISFISSDVFDKLATAHPEWPHMTGAIGPANRGSELDEGCRLMRIDRLQAGPVFLANVPLESCAGEPIGRLRSGPPLKAGFPIAGLMEPPPVGILGANALLNYRVGFDYAHSTIYFEFGRMYGFPAFDVIGLVLRPEEDARFTILGAVDFEGKPAVGVQNGDHLVAVDGIPTTGSTLGQVWAMLGGTPGQERRLTIERGGRQFVVSGRVQHFLAESP